MSFASLDRQHSELKNYIHVVKKTIKRQKKFNKSEGEWSHKIALDKDKYYVKLVPKDKHTIFRVFSDTLFFTPGNFREIQKNYYEFVHKNANTFTGFLRFIKSSCQSAEEYLDELNSGTREPEIILVLLSIIYERNLTILYSDEKNTLKNQHLDLGFSKNAHISILDVNAGFDTVYEKEHIKNCGLVQSIILDIVTQIESQKDEKPPSSATISTRKHYYK